MSDTRINVSTPSQATAAAAKRATPVPEPTGWVGWIFFAATMMLILGVFHVFQGLVALFNDEYYLVGPNGLTVQVDYTAWGWTHLILGVLVAAGGMALFAGQLWARIVGVAVAFLSAIVNVAFLAAYPIWSTILIALDVLVIWAITVHGDEMKNVRGDENLE